MDGAMELEIPRAMDELENEIKDLRDTAYMLGDRLGAVLSERPEEDVVEKKALKSFNCRTADMLDKKRYSISLVSYYLRDLIRRLEV